MTEASAKKRVLLCGGLMDGQWVDWPEDSHTLRFPKPLTLDMRQYIDANGLPDHDLMPEWIVYGLRPAPMSLQIQTVTQRLWIAFPRELYDREADEAIVRAIFQRDVAQQILGPR